jgi:hypothetical protein
VNGDTPCIRRASTVLPGPGQTRHQPQHDRQPIAHGARVQGHPGDSDKGDHQPDHRHPGQSLAQDQERDQGREGNPHLLGDDERAEVLGQPVPHIDQAKMDRPPEQDQQPQALPVRDPGPQERDQDQGRHRKAQTRDQQGRQHLGRDLGGGIVDPPDQDDGDNRPDLGQAQAF